MPSTISKSPPPFRRNEAAIYHRSNLLVNIQQREVYILRDGSIVAHLSKLPGFYYSFPIIETMERFAHIHEMKNVFSYCQKVFQTLTPFKFLFTCNGKILHCLHEAPPDTKILVVGHVSEFKGISEEPLSGNLITVERSPCYKSYSTDKQLDSSTMHNILSRFCIKPDKCRAVRTPGIATAQRSHRPKHHDSSISQQNRIQKIEELKNSLGVASYNIDKHFSTLFSQGIPLLKERYKFTGAELHNLYGKFKLLVLLSCGTDAKHDISSGINKKAFVEYYSKSNELEFVLGRIFEIFDRDGDGAVSWDEYLQAMDIIWYGTCTSQLELFFDVYDLDRNGLLSFREIQELCKLQLEINKRDDFIEELSHSFACIIFDLTKTPYSEEIPSSKIQELINTNNDKTLIEMFCSFSCLKT